MKTVNTTIEILGKLYPIRCTEDELAALKEAGAYLNQKMNEVQESGKAINLERIAIITALNITHQFLQMNQQKNNLVTKIHHRLASLQQKIDSTLTTYAQAELVYTSPEAEVTG